MNLQRSVRPLLAFAVLTVMAAAVPSAPRKPVREANSAAQQKGVPGGKVLLTNDRVEVVEGTLAPGAVAGMHKHTLAAVVIFVEGATIKETLPDGTTRTYERKPGEVAWRDAGFQHDEANVGQSRMRVIVVQLK